MNTVTIPSKTLLGISKFRVNKNLKDLKANIFFDKMLSDEMLSIKQQIFETNATPVTVQLSSKRYVLTPILELQQRWPIDRIQSNKEKNLDFEKHMKNIDEIADAEEINEQESNFTSERVLELRSLSEKLHKIDISTKSPRTPKQCLCVNGVERSHTSIHKHSKHILGYKEDAYNSRNPDECTRTTSTVSPYPFYITYSPYFVGTVADYTNFYYHPDAINDLKIPKHHKNRKHKKPVSEEIDDSLEDDRDYDYFGYEDNTKTTKTHKNKTTTNNKFKIIVHPTNEPEDSLDNREHFQVVDKDRFVEEIVEDLKTYYNEAVIKDCYCSSSTFKLGSQIIVFVYVLQFLI